jgi:hypothetical protein
MSFLEQLSHIYNKNPKYGYDFEHLDLDMANNRLFCSFTTLDGIDPLVESITNSYTIMYNKMFVLYIKSTDEYVVTYNVEQGNVSDIPDNTILVHRKKESNTLYTINA